MQLQINRSVFLTPLPGSGRALCTNRVHSSSAQFWLLLLAAPWVRRAIRHQDASGSRRVLGVCWCGPERLQGGAVTEGSGGLPCAARAEPSTRQLDGPAGERLSVPDNGLAS